MTTLAIEYYRRNGDAERGLRLPFSLFLTHQAGGRLVVTVHGFRGGLQVRHWRLSACRPDQPLPPCDERFLSPGTPLKNEATVLPGYRMLPYHLPERFVSPGLVWRFSATQLAGHARDVRGYLNCWSHRVRRERWLDEAFDQNYGPSLDDLAAVAFLGAWRRRLLLDKRRRSQPVAAEVVFGGEYPPLPLWPDDVAAI